jgi:hypothetical protein
LEALRSSAARVHDLVLDDIDGSSSLATSMSMVAEWLKGQIDATTANRVHWGSHSALVVAVLHFPELDVDLEVLGSRHNTGLTEVRGRLSLISGTRGHGLTGVGHSFFSCP